MTDFTDGTWAPPIYEDSESRFIYSGTWIPNEPKKETMIVKIIWQKIREFFVI